MMDWSGWEAHHNDDKRFIYEIIKKVPRSFWFYIRKRYNEIFKAQCKQKANLFILDLKGYFQSLNFKLASDDDELIKTAKKEAFHCTKVIINAANKEQALKKLIKIAKFKGIKPPKGKAINGTLARFKCEKWWRKKLRKRHGQLLEKIAYKLKIIHVKQNLYTSNVNVNRRKGQIARNKRILECLSAVNEEGAEYTLQELSDVSTSNPVIRRSELMARISGNEEIAKELKHKSVFLTLTCPSRMHSSLRHSGKPNPKYDETTPKQANDYLGRIWSHIRAALGNREILFYGLRIVEPHHDGTPHWHLLLFVEKKHLTTLVTIFKQHALKTDGDEKGAKKHRVKVEYIDYKKGSATAYIVKYISKNIDGYGIDADLYGRDAEQSAIRIEAWKSVWNIRQFQFFGNPPVSVWRELRRLKESNDTLINSAIQAADNGDWASFMKLMGGPCPDKRAIPIVVMRVWSDELNVYGEPKGFTIMGIETNQHHEVSRIHVWEIHFNGFKGERISTPWSSVNNCTQ